MIINHCFLGSSYMEINNSIMHSLGKLFMNNRESISLGFINTMGTSHVFIQTCFILRDF